MIIKKEDERNGKPVIAGTKIGVHQVYEWANTGISAEKLAERWEVSKEQIHQALDYAEENEEEIQELIQERDNKLIHEEGSLESRMNIITTYAPESYRLPVMMISTKYDDGNEVDHSMPCNSTAIMFGEALNGRHLIAKTYTTNEQAEASQIDRELLPISKFYEIKPHLSRKEAVDYHTQFVENMNYQKYKELYKEFCPERIKNKFKPEGRDD